LNQSSEASLHLAVEKVGFIQVVLAVMVVLVAVAVDQPAPVELKL
jgi:hypothetical protein